MLVQAAWAATRKNGSYLQSQLRRLKGRRGPKKAIVAVAASMLTAYFMLRDEKDYHDLGGRYLADRDKQRVTQRPIRRLQSFGVEVEVKVAISPAARSDTADLRPGAWPGESSPRPGDRTYPSGDATVRRGLIVPRLNRHNEPLPVDPNPNAPGGTTTPTDAACGHQSSSGDRPAARDEYRRGLE